MNILEITPVVLASHPPQDLFDRTPHADQVSLTEAITAAYLEFLEESPALNQKMLGYVENAIRSNVGEDYSPELHAAAVDLAQTVMKTVVLEHESRCIDEGPLRWLKDFLDTASSLHRRRPYQRLETFLPDLPSIHPVIRPLIYRLLTAPLFEWRFATHATVPKGTDTTATEALTLAGEAMRLALDTDDNETGLRETMAARDLAHAAVRVSVDLAKHKANTNQ